MNRMKKLLSLLLALAMVLSVAAMITGCKEQGKPDASTESKGPDSDKSGTYTVTVQSVGGLPLEKVDVYVYADSSLADLKEYGETDSEGKISFNLPASDDYAITLDGAPAGYAVKESYTFTGNTAKISLTSSLIEGESLSGATLGLGDVMYDFTVTNQAGEEITLSEVLAEKKMVLLNFFFTTCSPCITEFPYMQEAYEMRVAAAQKGGRPSSLDNELIWTLAKEGLSGTDIAIKLNVPKTTIYSSAGWKSRHMANYEN